MLKISETNYYRVLKKRCKATKCEQEHRHMSTNDYEYQIMPTI